MLLLKVILVVLISEIDSGPAPSVTEIEKAPESLPQESLINNTEPNGCKYQLLPYWSENGMESGFLTVDCEKNCPEGTHETAVDGDPCVMDTRRKYGYTRIYNLKLSKAALMFLRKDEVDVTVGSCDKGCCTPDSPPKHLTVTLMVEGEEEEG
uniref:Putative secreted protein n=1 Tax=Ixodes ricinus TaxID=34613 RepID=A0A090XB38_IXORI